ncbi:MAG TPA: hypothetical protein VK797_23140 [Tepidisphaeraceae bacterium]|jgi:hypothetical protein|nr:hypothetical protein [Tepidisphaeraceae bacterium]
MPLPIKIESIESAKARFPRAIEKCWDAETIKEDQATGSDDRPGKHREHVFDLERHPGTSYRLIVSRERIGLVEKLHVSCSQIEGAMPATLALANVGVLLSAISNLELGGSEVHFSQGGVAHMLFDWPLPQRK